MTGGAKLEFKEYEVRKALKVLGWSAASVVVAFLISLVASVEVAPEYAILIPVVNTVLYAVKEFITDNSVVE